MQKKYLYEYAVIRFLPRVEREEFFNVGVILFSREADFIKIKYAIDEKKLSLFTSELDIDSLKSSLLSYDRICSGNSSTGIAKLDIAERFRWLTAIKSTSIQNSRPQTGFSADMDETLDKLFNEFVL